VLFASKTSCGKNTIPLAADPPQLLDPECRHLIDLPILAGAYKLAVAISNLYIIACLDNLKTPHTLQNKRFCGVGQSSSKLY
jgi:hypothetical protein